MFLKLYWIYSNDRLDWLYILYNSTDVEEILHMEQGLFNINEVDLVFGLYNSTDLNEIFQMTGLDCKSVYLLCITWLCGAYNN